MNDILTGHWKEKLGLKLLILQPSRELVQGKPWDISSKEIR